MRLAAVRPKPDLFAATRRAREKDGTSRSTTTWRKSHFAKRVPAPPAHPEKLDKPVDVFCARVWGVPTTSLAHVKRAMDKCFRKNEPDPKGRAANRVGGARAPTKPTQRPLQLQAEG